METDVDDDDLVNWKQFHNTTREYVIFLLLFVFLYVTSYFFISLFRTRANSYPDCYEDAFANRISLWMCSFSLSISIGAALLLPISIISNEVLLLYPNSYYVQWLNSSLIQGLWNLVFLFSNVSLFLLLPFSHFILESEGFPGSPKGIMSRVNEALLVLSLVGLVVMGIIYTIAAIFDDRPYFQSAFSKSWKSNLDDISNYYLPFLYSCVSFLGVLMLLLCTPFGFARLFSVMADLLRQSKKHSGHVKSHSNLSSPKSSDSDRDTISLIKCSNVYQRRIETREDIYRIDSVPESNSYCDLEDDEEKSKFSSSSLRKNCLYPTVMVILVLLTILSVLMVTHNTLELCFGVKSLPLYSQNLSLGISSLSSLGPAGASVEIIMILYLWCTSVVGLYSLPLLCHLKPKLSSTSLTQVIGNCTVLLVLSSALPVLARSLGITNFDLLGDFGRINWLGNFYIVVFHNIVFVVTVAVCLGKKITGSVRKEIYDRLCSFSWFPFM